VHTDNDYLFIRRQIPDKYLETHEENLRKLDTKAITKVYRRLAEKARKSTPCNDWGFIRSHNIRKYFNRTLLNAGADSFFTEFLMGHTLDDTRSAYFRASPVKLKEIYRKFVPYLIIQKELDISESPEYQKIKYENSVLQAETTRHVVERSELQELRAEIERMKKINEEASKYQQKVINFDDPMVMEQLRKFLNENSKMK